MPFRHFFDLIDGELIFKFVRKINLNCKIIGANDLNMLKNMEIIYIAFILEYVVLNRRGGLEIN